MAASTPGRMASAANGGTIRFPGHEAMSFPDRSATVASEDAWRHGFQERACRRITKG